MSQEEKFPERERRDWFIILFILLFGLLCVILAGGWAIRFSPTWSLNTNMGSNIDPNSDFLTTLPDGFIEPLDPSILTQPAWINVFLTPSASFETSIPATPLPTNTPFPAVTFVPTIISTFPPTPTNTFVYIPPPPPTNTPKPKPPPSSTSSPSSTLPPSSTSPPSPTYTSTPSNSADLVITKNDDDGSSTYTQGGTVSYVIVVSNPVGPDSVTGATVTDIFPAQIGGTNWVCVPTGGAACTPNGTGNINDTVNLPVGSYVTYSVTASVSTSASGTIINTASVNVPGGVTEVDSSNNSDSSSDNPSSGEPDIGGPDGGSYNPGPSGSITILFSPGIYANGDVGTYDFVYYEIENSPGSSQVDMDWVMIEISSDGITWYTVFVWGNGNPDTNSNLDTNIIGGTETDNRTIPFAIFYNNTGVAIDIDSIPGIATGTTYSWMRISGIGGADGPDIDAVQPYYP